MVACAAVFAVGPIVSDLDLSFSLVFVGAPILLLARSTLVRSSVFTRCEIRGRFSRDLFSEFLFIIPEAPFAVVKSISLTAFPDQVS